ncbi:hypothetical protein [Aeromicrobium sp. Root495]|uniref:hypothetical protein n=1 Tax=Aeromicrobium sp. Root495 TaxID=1736550 RepID=UPI000AB8B105|nr:hypothetical protein [Aeromicrobium sp. Root495]
MASSSIALESITDLLEAFESADVRYVHWKSNINVREALAGDDDLDILVHPDDSAVVENLISARGLHRVATPKDKWQPNMYHYYGLDQGAGKLVHLHLHYGLTLGFDFHKNYTLPIVNWYLDRPATVQGIRVPAPEKELIVFVIRTLIKHARAVGWSEFPLAQVRRARRMSNPFGATPLKRAEQVELKHLAGLADEDQLASEIGSLGIGLSHEAFQLYVSNLQAHPEALLGDAAELKRTLRPYGENSEIVSISKAAGRLTTHRARSVATRLGLPTRRNRTLESGGRIFAFIGGDGAGKSTNVAALTKTLASAIDCTTLHVGRPQRTLAATGMKAASVALQKIGRPDASDTALYLGVAHSRRASFKRAERLRARGSVVILDRLPHANISVMDVPRVNPRSGRFGAWASRLERRWYEPIRGVDMLVVLRLDPSIALTRRAEDDAATLLLRSGEVWNGDWSGAGVHVFNTGESGVEDIRKSVLSAAWNCATRTPIRTELVGLSGAGKSSAQTYDSRGAVRSPASSLPYRSYPTAIFVSAIQVIARHGIPLTRHDIRVFQAMAQLRWFVKFASRRATMPSESWQSYVLDQGPIFHLALGIREDRIAPGSDLYRDAVSAIRSWCTGPVIYLDAPNSVLARRVRNRDQDTRSSRLDDQALASFFDEYRRILNSLVGELGEVAAVDSDRPPREVAADVRHLLEA